MMFGCVQILTMSSQDFSLFMKMMEDTVPGMPVLMK